MKNFLTSLILCSSCMTLVIHCNPNQELLKAAQQGDLATIKTIFSTNISTKGEELPDCCTISMATRLAFDAKKTNANTPEVSEKIDKVITFLLTKNTCKGATLTGACSAGDIDAVQTLLASDESKDANSTFVNQNHIYMAKAFARTSKTHAQIAKLLIEHLIARDYAFAGTIKLDEKNAEQ